MKATLETKSWIRIAFLTVMALYIYSCTTNNNTLSSSASSGTTGTPTATPCPNPVSVLVSNTTAYQVEMIFDGSQFVYIPAGGNFTFKGCPGQHAFTMAGVCPPGVTCTVPCPACLSMNYNPAYAICGRAFTCTTSNLVAGSLNTINVTQAVSPMACSGEIDWTCP